MFVKNKLSLILIILLLVAVSIIAIQQKSAPKTGYVLIQELYNGFEMKK